MGLVVGGVELRTSYYASGSSLVLIPTPLMVPLGPFNASHQAARATSGEIAAAGGFVPLGGYERGSVYSLAVNCQGGESHSQESTGESTASSGTAAPAAPASPRFVSF